MNKISTIFLLITSLSVSVYSKEPDMAFLMNIISNDLQHFRIKNYNFYCKSYGVVSVDELLRDSKIDNKCKDSADKFYKREKELKYFTESKLEVMQRYHLEFKDDECIVYASGEKTLSELLLSQGLALKKPQSKDERFESYLIKAQSEAKKAKRGIWEDNVLKECVSSIHK